MTKRKRQLQKKKIIALLVVVGVAIIGSAALMVSNAATPMVAIEPEAGTVVAPAQVVNDSTASSSKAVKFTAADGGGICNDPFASTSAERGDIDIGTDGRFQVRNEAWNPDHGPQTIYACSEQSWYVTSNQPDLGGAVQTYPDSIYWIRSSKTISQYTTMTSTFAEEYKNQGNWNASYDIWLNNFSKEVMIWNEWNGSPGYWPSQAKIAVSLNGVPYHFAKNGTILQFFRDTEVKSGAVDILAALKWLLANDYLTASDVPTQIEYGVEICSTVGTQRFDTTGFTVDVN